MTLFTHRNAGGRCPCGAANAACGPPSDVVPVDQLIEEVAAVSGPLKKYRVTRGGVETVMKLNEADAKRLGVGADHVVGAASTIPVVEPVEESEGGDGDGAADDAGDVQAVAVVGAGSEPVQPVADSGGDSPAPGDAQAAADPGGQEEAAVSETGDDPAATEPADPGDAPTVKAPARAPAKKTAAKKQTASANKARTAAANKAAGSGG
ncbi:hypothetical protein [Streptomyces scabiei]|uniref:hypothetical protein n=1 Tax=Streptomyces scabiei TaxID=1930 RepID=UPI001B30E3E8|nr:hypothetical protein [Streptomyces sp. LBUM 1475]QTU64223.1 hypothetical protein F3K22_27290 [Streptomyces sp. LBUM 1475]